ncbi:hypothetical protein AMS68_007409 [Peltaster fructicola]|uniref:Xylose isomerase-like TIM barrel domain-containing protein n=1 Tax=Peltaster fructicola TaxID=286661 RepID=A0A6H0Y4D8_9PEZI|nr:hypothetical protein AMS68_007409 [Peltaster fructicola]
MPHHPAISSHSLGRAWVHDTPPKLDAARQYGLDLELFYEDLEHVAKAFAGGVTPANIVKAAHLFRALCDEAQINIVCLQPFMHYEGLRDRVKHAARIEEMKLWIQLAGILRTELIAVPSSFLPDSETSGDLDLIVSDLQEIADLDSSIRFSYEALCWGTHINTWEQSWQIVQAVDRPNFGLCLDTFNMAGKMYADPEARSGKTLHADRDVEQSLQRLRRVDVDKIFFLQIVDAQKLAEPLTPAHALYDAKQPSRMSWSRNCRLFYGEDDRGAYLPVQKILHTIINELGFTGPTSAELFNACLTDPSPDTPYQLAERAAESFVRLREDFGAVDGYLKVKDVVVGQSMSISPPRSTASFFPLHSSEKTVVAVA